MFSEDAIGAMAAALGDKATLFLEDGSKGEINIIEERQPTETVYEDGITIAGETVLFIVEGRLSVHISQGSIIEYGTQR